MTITAHPWGPAGTPSPLAKAKRDLATTNDELGATRESLALVRSALGAAEAEVVRLRKVADAAADLGFACKSEALKDALTGLHAVKS